MVLARKWKAAAGRPRGTGAQAVNPGKAMLNAEADKVVGEERGKIVKALLASLLECKNTTSAKLLFDLADGRINCEDPVVMSQLWSYAEKLKSEQQLAADAIDEKAEKKLDEAVS